MGIKRHADGFQKLVVYKGPEAREDGVPELLGGDVVAFGMIGLEAEGDIEGMVIPGHVEGFRFAGLRASRRSRARCGYWRPALSVGFRDELGFGDGDPEAVLCRQEILAEFAGFGEGFPEIIAADQPA